MYPVGDVLVTLEILNPEQPDVGEIVAFSTSSGSGYFPLMPSHAENIPYHTGDVAQQLEDGSLMPLGRVRDALLTSGGTQFTPGLEGKIAQAMMFERVIVLVDELDRRRAHVVVQSSVTMVQKKHSAFLELLEQLDIDARIAVLDWIPLTPTGKPDRVRVRNLFQLSACQHRQYYRIKGSNMSASSVQPQGFRSIIANLGIKDDRDDFIAVISDVPASISAMFTQSRFAGPSVTLSREVGKRDTEPPRFSRRLNRPGYVGGIIV